MRRWEQLSLDRPGIEHIHARELGEIGRILDEDPGMAKLITQDLVRGLKDAETGAPGLAGGQVLRILLIKQMNGFSYQELAFHLADSVTYRSFCGFGALEARLARTHSP